MLVLVYTFTVMEKNDNYSYAVKMANKVLDWWNNREENKRKYKVFPPALEVKLKEHELWLNTYGREGQRLNVSGMENLCDLDFSNRDLRFMIAKNTGFQRCNFSGANLGCADLEFSKLWRANFDATILVGANLRSSFSRLVSFQNSFIRESDIRIFHHDIMGPQRTFNSLIVVASSLVASGGMVLPLAEQFAGPVLAPAVALAILAALIHRPVIDLARGGWYFRPIKNMQEVLENSYQKTLALIENNLSDQINYTPELRNEVFSIRSPENIEMDRQIAMERGIIADQSLDANDESDCVAFEDFSPGDIKKIKRDATKNIFVNNYFDEISTYSNDNAMMASEDNNETSQDFK